MDGSEDKRMSLPKGRRSDLREWVLLLGGLAGVAHETLIRDFDRPSLIAIFALMMGLPFFRRAD